MFRIINNPMKNNQVSEIHNSNLMNDNCDICYEDNDTLLLECCNNSKKICYSCISCLTKYICPYCRQELPEDVCKIIYKNINKEIRSFSEPPRYSHLIGDMNTNMYSRSYNENIDNSWFLFIESENLIDPYSDYFSNRDSRILRRQMRKLRKRYMKTDNYRTRTEIFNESRKEMRRRNRRNIRTNLNNITRNIQINNNSDMDDLIFSMAL